MNDKRKEEVRKLKDKIFQLREKANQCLQVGASDEHWKCLKEISDFEKEIQQLKKGGKK